MVQTIKPIVELQSDDSNGKHGEESPFMKPWLFHFFQRSRDEEVWSSTWFQLSLMSDENKAVISICMSYDLSLEREMPEGKLCNLSLDKMDRSGDQEQYKLWLHQGRDTK